MRISKSTHLIRLLQTQDTLLCGFVFLAQANALWLTGLASATDVIQHLWLVLVVMALAVFASSSSSPKLHGQSAAKHLQSTFKFVCIVSGGLSILVFSVPVSSVPPFLVLVYAGVLLSVLLVNRLFLAWYYLQGRKEHQDNFLRVLIIGAGPRAESLTHAYAENSDWGIKVVAVLDPEPGSLNHMSNHTSTVKPLDNLETVLETEVVDEVIVCTPRSYANKIVRVANICEEHGVCLKHMADLYDIESKQISLEQVGSVPLITFEPVAQDELKLVVKRVFDLLVVIGVMVLTAPLWILLAALIKLDSPGPVFFAQTRVGLNKRLFKMYKFRSMRVNAEQELSDIEHMNEAKGPIFKIKDDPRVTRVGKVLRQSSLDELPQLLNVFLGHMSVIGPRPMSLRDVEQFSLGIQRKRFSVRPGLACLREVSGRSRLSFEEWLRLDLQYIEEWSLMLDLKILIRLVPAVIKGDGAG